MSINKSEYIQLNPLQKADGVVALTPSLLIMSANHVIRWLIGYEPKPGKMFPLSKLFREPELTRVRATINNTLENGQPGVGLEAELLCHSGDKFLCGYSVYPIFDTNQSATGTLLCFQKKDRTLSIVKTQKTRYEMRHNLISHEGLIDKLPEGVFTITTHWRISSFNQTAEKITGYKREEAIGKYCWEVFRSDVCKLSCPLRNALNGGQSYIDQEVRIFNKGGSRQAILVNTNVLRDTTGMVLGAVETFRPIGGEMYPADGTRYHHSFENIIGKSDSMQRLFSMLPDIAVSDANVLISGESGTGKDLIARAIHNHSLRSKGPFVSTNCVAFAETLLESELFGHEKAAFTGAEHSKPGRFEMAKGGTLFLDEIGELKPELQVKLLRVLDQREFERVGGTQTLSMEARIISATNKNLTEAIKKGLFREDFYYRLRTVPLNLPPLRERREDIPLLINHFIKRFNKQYNKKIRTVDTKVSFFFQKYPFPGNVRELERALEHAYVFAKGPVIFMSSLPEFAEFNKPDASSLETYHLAQEKLNRETVSQALSISKGKREKASELLGISRTTLWRYIKKFGLN
jgi:PAS domain S-box-containing protein